jgi:hypothetical protein
MQHSAQFEEILAQALQLPPAERMAIIERLAASFRPLPAGEGTLPGAETDQALTEQETADLMRVEPLPPAEVVRQRLTGTWADLGISDGAEWVNEQKRKRSEH